MKHTLAIQLLKGMKAELAKPYNMARVTRQLHQSDPSYHSVMDTALDRMNELTKSIKVLEQDAGLADKQNNK